MKKLLLIIFGSLLVNFIFLNFVKAEIQRNTRIESQQNVYQFEKEQKEFGEIVAKNQENCECGQEIKQEREGRRKNITSQQQNYGRKIKSLSEEKRKKLREEQYRHQQAVQQIIDGQD